MLFVNGQTLTGYLRSQKKAMPPLGVIPRQFIDEDRLVVLKNYIERCTNAFYPLVESNVKEYNEIIERLKSDST